MAVSNRNLLFQGSIFGGYVNFRERSSWSICINLTTHAPVFFLKWEGVLATKIQSQIFTQSTTPRKLKTPENPMSNHWFNQEDYLESQTPFFRMPKGRNQIWKMATFFFTASQMKACPCLNVGSLSAEEYVRLKKYVKSERVMGNSESRKQDLNFKCGQKK